MLAKTPAEMEENTETFLDALNAFEHKPSREIPTELEQLLCRIARNGEPLFPWNKLKPLVVAKLENVIQEYIQSNPCEEVPLLPNVENVKFDDMRERLLLSLNAFNSAPFTMQRLCELLTQPKRYYQRSDKFMRGVEKNVQVVSTITPTGKRITHSCEFRNQTLMMNGIPSDTHTQTSTVSSDSQPAAGEPTPSDETNHTNGNEAALPQPHDAATTPQPDDAVVTPAAGEQSVDSTRQTADVSASEPVKDTCERTSSGDGNVSAATDRDSKEMSNEYEAEASCEPMEIDERTGTGDSDDSDGNKGDGDQDSCSSMDSADSGGSSPDSALPPSSGFFGTIKMTDAAKDTTPDPKAHDEVDSSSCTNASASQDKSTSGPSSMPQPDQSHSSIAPPSQGGDDVSSPPPPPPPVSSAATDTSDTRTDKTSPETSTAEASTAEASTAEASTAEASTAEASTAEASNPESSTPESSTPASSTAVASAAVTSAAVTSAAVTSAAVTSAAEASAAVTSAAVTSATEASATVTSATVTSATVTSATVTSATVTSATVTSATEASATEASATEASAIEASAEEASKQEPDQSDVKSVDEGTPMEQD